MKVTLPYPPSANRYWRHVGRNVVVSKEARLYRTNAALRAKAAGMRPVDGPAKVTLEVFRPRKSGDLDNSIKVLMDALRGVAYRDDSQVVEIRAHRWDDATNPRVEVRVEAVALPKAPSQIWSDSEQAVVDRREADRARRNGGGA